MVAFNVQTRSSPRKFRCASRPRAGAKVYTPFFSFSQENKRKGSTVNITQLLSRRSDLSGFIVHLTRRGDDRIPPARNLKSILKQRIIEARSPFGPAAQELGSRQRLDLDSQRCVSFSETPLEHLHCLTQRIAKRRFSLSSFGLAFTKMTARKLGVNPVWYVDITPGHDWLMNPINELIKSELKSPKKFRGSPLAQVTPFIEQMGSGLGRSGYGYRKEFWWEREWRYRGDFSFALDNVALGLAPERQIEKFGSFSEKLGRRIPFVDPKWSLERMVAHLSKCTGATTPFD